MIFQGSWLIILNTMCFNKIGKINPQCTICTICICKSINWCIQIHLRYIKTMSGFQWWARDLWWISPVGNILSNTFIDTEALPSDLFCLGSGFSCKSLSKLQNMQSVFKRAMTDKNQDTMFALVAVKYDSKINCSCVLDYGQFTYH